MTAPLENIRVVDFGRYIAGPFCASLLGDFGAEVIRVEKQEGRDDRTLVSLAEDAEGRPREGAMFLQMNRNKKSLTLNPTTAKGREVVERLVKSADVIVANLPGEALKAMGLDYETVSKLNPRAILAVASTFGLDGPYAARVGFDGVAQAMSGASYFSGTEELPVRFAASYVDFGTASLLAFGVMTALKAREETGKGQLVEGALLRTAMTYFSQMLIEEAVTHRGRTPTINRLQTAAPNDVYKAKDGWIIVAVNGDPLFRRLCRLIGAEEWIGDPRFGSDKARGDHGEFISARVADWVATRTSAEAVALLEAARVPAGPVYTMAEALADPHVQASDFFTEVDFPGIGKAPVAATPVKLHATPGTVRTRAPLLGEHTDQVLTDLGYSTNEIAAMKAEGVV